MICLPEVKHGGLTTCIIFSSPFPNHTEVRIKDLKRSIHKNKEKRRKEVRIWEISPYFLKTKKWRSN